MTEGVARLNYCLNGSPIRPPEHNPSYNPTKVPLRSLRPIIHRDVIVRWGPTAPRRPAGLATGKLHVCFNSDPGLLAPAHPRTRQFINSCRSPLPRSTARGRTLRSRDSFHGLGETSVSLLLRFFDPMGGFKSVERRYLVESHANINRDFVSYRLIILGDTTYSR